MGMIFAPKGAYVKCTRYFSWILVIFILALVYPASLAVSFCDVSATQRICL